MDIDIKLMDRGFHLYNDSQLVQNLELQNNCFCLEGLRKVFLIHSYLPHFYVQINLIGFVPISLSLKLYVSILLTSRMRCVCCHVMFVT